MSVSATVVVINTNLEALGTFSELEQSAPDLEQCLDWVTGLVWQGYTLCSVTIHFDYYDCLILTPHLFDGQLFSPVIDQLVQEWRTILATH